MTPEQLYQELKDLAEKLSLKVTEQNFRTTGIPVKSGFCRIKGEMHCIIDKHIGLHKKTRVLAQCLRRLPHEDLYVVPAVREMIHPVGRKKGGGRKPSSHPEG